MKILFALAVTGADAPNAERLLDFIHHREPKCGDLLLGLYADVHDEVRARIRISAALAFANVHEIEIRPLADPKAPPFAITNSAFRQMATHIDLNTTWPFVWIEPDCTPAIKGWRQKLWESYESQPYPFFGNRMRKPKGEKTPEIFFMARVAVYPKNTATLFPDRPEMPFEIATTNVVMPRIGITKLIQSARINSEADLISVRDDAILVSGDKSGLLMKQISEMPDPDAEAVKIEVKSPATLDPIAVPKLNRRTPIAANGAKT